MQSTSLLATSLSAAIVVLAGACGDQTNGAMVRHPQKSAALDVRDARLRGDFGPRSGFDGPATDVVASSDEDLFTSSATLVRDDPTHGTAMMILWTDGVTLDTIDPGVHTYTYDPSLLAHTPVSMNVCSGADANSIDWDKPADTVTATVTDDGDGSRSFQLHTETQLVDPVTGDSGGVTSADTTFTLRL